jgi:hypothetical protein
MKKVGSANFRPLRKISIVGTILSSTPAREDLKTERKERTPVKIKSNVKAGQGLWGQ